MRERLLAFEIGPLPRIERLIDAKNIGIGLEFHNVENGVRLMGI